MAKRSFILRNGDSNQRCGGNGAPDKMRVVGNDMEYKNTNEPEESKGIQFGSIKMLAFRLFGLGDRCLEHK